MYDGVQREGAAQASVFGITAISAPRALVGFATTARRPERSPDDAHLPVDRVSLSVEAQQELRRIDETGGPGESSEQGEPGEQGAPALDATATGKPGEAAGKPGDAGGKSGDAGGRIGAAAKLTDEQRRQVTELQQRDAHVRAHEAAHQSAGGDLTGPASFSYQLGPDGKNYAVGGEVPVQASSGRTPDETVAIARRVRAAALAPSDPSSADLAAASSAAQMELRAMQQKRQQGAAPGAARGAGPEAPTGAARKVGEAAAIAQPLSLERLIVRAPEAQPFM